MTATVGSVSATASLTVTAAQVVRVSSITYTSSSWVLQITVRVVNGSGSPVAGASVSIAVTRNGSPYTTGTGTSGSTGNVTFNAFFPPSGCYATTVTKLTATGLTWDGVSPANSVCR